MDTQRHLTQFGLAAETTPGARPYATLSQRPDEEGVFATDEDHAPLYDDEADGPQYDDEADGPKVTRIERDYARDEWPIVPDCYRIQHLSPAQMSELVMLVNTSNGETWMLKESLHGVFRWERIARDASKTD